MATVRHLIIITGPTGSGKTQLAIDMAKTLGCHIISADSRQIYKGIPITTACPTEQQLQEVPHHLVQALPLQDNYSAARFQADTLNLLTGPHALDSEYAIVSGGSMLYIHTLLHGIDDMPNITPYVRERIASLHRQHGTEGLLAMLQITDPDTYNSIDRNNTRRIIHALEVSAQAGRPYSQLRTGKKNNFPFTISTMMINHPREELFNRINQRTEEMVAQGMEQEARENYHLRGLNALNTVGFKEWFAHFDGLMDRPTTIARIQKNTRVYAKKQLTWLARYQDIVTLDPAKPLLQQALQAISPLAP